MQINKKRHLYVGALISLLTLSGCNPAMLSGIPATPTQSATFAVAPTSQPSVTPMPDSSSAPASSTYKATRTSTSTATTTTTTTVTATATATVAVTCETAPSYEEIKANVFAIAGTTQAQLLQAHLTQEQRTQLLTYQRSLKGKRIEGWVGWTHYISPLKETLLLDEQAGGKLSHDHFYMGVSMADQNTKVKTWEDIDLQGLTREQVEQFPEWSAPIGTESFPQKVAFSGTILGIRDFTYVYIQISQVAPVK